MDVTTHERNYEQKIVYRYNIFEIKLSRYYQVSPLNIYLKRNKDIYYVNSQNGLLAPLNV